MFPDYAEYENNCVQKNELKKDTETVFALFCHLNSPTHQFASITLYGLHVCASCF